MKNFIIITKKSFSAVLLFLLVLLLIFLQAVKDFKKQKPEDFINSLNICVGEMICKKDVVIPYTFNANYNQYNNIQKRMGFDLSLFKGCRVKLYTYSVLTEKTESVSILVYKGSVIGGDYSGEDFTKPLR